MCCHVCQAASVISVVSVMSRLIYFVSIKPLLSFTESCLSLQIRSIQAISVKPYLLSHISPAISTTLYLLSYICHPIFITLMFITPHQYCYILFAVSPNSALVEQFSVMCTTHFNCLCSQCTRWTMWTKLIEHQTTMTS